MKPTKAITKKETGNTIFSPDADIKLFQFK